MLFFSSKIFKCLWAVVQKIKTPHLLILKKVSVDSISQHMLWSLQPSHRDKANIDTQILLKRRIRAHQNFVWGKTYVCIHTNGWQPPQKYINAQKISDTIVLSMKI